ncbi:hypothetical protein AMJ86_06210, partial [bacterium SM23_57]
RRLGSKYPLNDLRIANLPSRFKGTILLLLVEFEFSQACFFGLGAIGKPDENVADEAIDDLEKFLKTSGVVDKYLADQLLLPLVFTDDSSIYSTPVITKHLLTNAAVIHHFSPGIIQVEGEIGKPGTVRVNHEFKD